MPYAGPAGQAPPVPPPTSDAQRVFDTVTGPNVRVSDNLIQLAAVVVGVVLGAVAVRWFVPQGGPQFMVLGAIGGAVAGVFVSGAVIGVVRFVKAVRKR